MSKKEKPPEIWETIPITDERARELVECLVTHDEPERVEALVGLICALHVQGGEALLGGGYTDGNASIVFAAMFHAYSRSDHFNDSLFEFLISRGFAHDYRARRRAKKGGGRMMKTNAARKPSTTVDVQPASIPATIARFDIYEGTLWGAGILKGDTAIVLLNCEIQPEDLVLVHTPEGLQILQYHPAPGGRVKLRTVECARSRGRVYEPKDAVILGRVVQVQWQGKVVQTVVKLRPVY